MSAIDPTKRFVFVELGPRLNFSTAWSTNAINIFRSCGLSKVQRIEQSRRLLLRLACHDTVDDAAFHKAESQFISSLYDRMTEMIYREPLTSFKLNMTPEVLINATSSNIITFLTLYFRTGLKCLSSSKVVQHWRRSTKKWALHSTIGIWTITRSCSRKRFNAIRLPSSALI